MAGSWMTQLPRSKSFIFFRNSRTNHRLLYITSHKSKGLRPAPVAICRWWYERGGAIVNGVVLNRKGGYMKPKVSLKKLKGVSKTLLIPLRGRYLETKRDGGIINDPKSL